MKKNILYLTVIASCLLVSSESGAISQSGARRALEKSNISNPTPDEIKELEQATTAEDAKKILDEIRKQRAKGTQAPSVPPAPIAPPPQRAALIKAKKAAVAAEEKATKAEAKLGRVLKEEASLMQQIEAKAREFQAKRAEAEKGAQENQPPQVVEQKVGEVEKVGKESISLQEQLRKKIEEFRKAAKDAEEAQNEAASKAEAAKKAAEKDVSSEKEPQGREKAQELADIAAKKEAAAQEKAKLAQEILKNAEKLGEKNKEEVASQKQSQSFLEQIKQRKGKPLEGLRHVKESQKNTYERERDERGLTGALKGSFEEMLKRNPNLEVSQEEESDWESEEWK